MLGTKISKLETPALLVDLPAMERDLATMSEFFRGRAAKLRPHFKNHRVLALSRAAEPYHRSAP